MAPKLIVPLTAIPTVEGNDPSLAASVIYADGGNAIEVFGKCNANNGRLHLLRNTLDNKWHPVDGDAQDLKSIRVDSGLPAGVLAGFFSGTWLPSDVARSGAAYYVVVLIGTATFSEIYAATRRV